MLEAIAGILMRDSLITSTWQDETREQGELVKLCRDYYNGYHRLQLTTEMKKMINISDDKLDRYNINYCALIIDRMADRLTVAKFEAKSITTPTPNPSPVVTGEGNPMPDSSMQEMHTTDQTEDPAHEWVEQLMEYNRFDGLQSDIAVAYLRDGLTFVSVQYDDTLKRECFYQEDAYDGDTGVIVVYQRGTSQIAAAVKIWYDVPPTPEEKVNGETNSSLFKRVNVYYPNRTDKYYSSDSQSLVQFVDPEETIRMGKSPGVPIVPFYNKGGISELVNIIPLQDSLNSQLVDLVMAGRLTAFSIFFGVNVNVPQGLTPGMTILKNLVDSNGTVVVPQSVEESQAQANYLNASKLERIQGGDLSQIIAGIDTIITQIGVISSTPLPGQMGGDSSSGEALKQREIGMLGKLTRAQVQIGNAWEDVVYLANYQQTLFGDQHPPVLEEVSTKWKSAELRNDADVLTLYKLLNDAGYERAALRVLAQSGLANWSEDDIKRMMDEKAKDVASKLDQAMGGVNGFGNLNVPTMNPLNFNPVNSVQ